MGLHKHLCTVLLGRASSPSFPRNRRALFPSPASLPLPLAAKHGGSGGAGGCFLLLSPLCRCGEARASTGTRRWRRSVSHPIFWPVGLSSAFASWLFSFTVLIALLPLPIVRTCGDSILDLINTLGFCELYYGRLPFRFLVHPSFSGSGENMVYFNFELFYWSNSNGLRTISLEDLGIKVISNTFFRGHKRNNDLIGRIMD